MIYTYKGNSYNIGDILYYNDINDLAIGIIIGRHKNTHVHINWVWTKKGNPLTEGEEWLEWDDFEQLSDNFEKITEQEKLAIILKNGK